MPSLCRAIIGAVILFVGAAVTPATASILTETYNFAMLVGYGSESGTSFAQFNPALGTLNSITFNDTLTAIFSGGGATDDNIAGYTLSVDFGPIAVVSIFDGILSGNGSVSVPFTSFTQPSLGGVFTGTGMVDTSVSVTNILGSPASFSSTFGTESVTYNYTPVAAVPEPGTLALFGAGLAGLMGLLRRQGRESITA